jgi:CDP-4-dehydro-6-deoxyglucose reductase
MYKIEFNELKLESSSNTSILECIIFSIGVNLDFCNKGVCGSCKVKLLHGNTILFNIEEGLSEFEKEEKFILACCRYPISDLILVKEIIEECKFLSLPCKINDIEFYNLNTAILHLRLPNNHNFIYKPGQFINLTNSSGVTRSYSLGAYKAFNNLLEIHIRNKIDGKFSDYIFHNSKINDLLRLNGPFGNFVLNDIQDKELLFLATNTGIAPIKALLEQIEFNNFQPKSISIYWGVRVKEDFYIDINSKKTKIVKIVSKPSNDWDGPVGYVQDMLLIKNINMQSTLVYACGSPKMISDVQALLVSNGLPINSFIYDKFQ